MIPLSTLHISPQPNQYVRIRPDVEYKPSNFTYYRKGSLIEVEHEKFRIQGRGYRTHGGIRGEVTQFTPKSRKRLMNLFGMMNQENLPLFVTLTWPEDFPIDSVIWKKEFDKFDKRLNRKFPHNGLIWRLEPQKRAAPHFHLLVWNVALYDLQRFVPYAWAAVVGSADENHLLWHLGALGNEHCVKEVDSWEQAVSYAAKYMGKPIDKPLLLEYGWGSPGRFWGVRRRENLPMAVAENVPFLNEKAVNNLMRAMCRKAGIRRRGYSKLSVLVKDTQEWTRLAEYYKDYYNSS